MKIIILGAGEVGSRLTENLSRNERSQEYDITLIDTSISNASRLNIRLDIQSMQGHACNISLLREAGAEQADMIVAATNNDEVNLAACRIATAIFQTPRTLSRIRSVEYYKNRTLIEEMFGVSVMINPEYSVAQYVQNLINYPYAKQITLFSRHSMLLEVATDVATGLIGQKIAHIQEKIGMYEAGCVSLLRDGSMQPAQDNITLRAGDSVYILLRKQQADVVMARLVPDARAAHRVVIIGGGHVGQLLAKALQYDYKVKLIERNPEQCARAASECFNTLVIQGSGNDVELLRQEVGHVDVVCAVTNSDEVNITASMLAKQNGAKRAIALLNSDAYMRLAETENLYIDIAFSPQDLVLSMLLSHIHLNNTVRVQSLHHGIAEAVQVNIEADSQSSGFIGKKVQELALPESAYVIAIIHKQTLILSLEDVALEDTDRLLIILADQNHYTQIADLFGEESLHNE